MKFGLYGINFGACLEAEVAARVARAAEDAGFDSLWTAEHVVLPEPRTPESPLPASTPLLSPTVALAHLISHTTTIKLATGIIILPQRVPAVLAKDLASIDVMSGGRLIFGLGVGYIPKEFEACGASFEDRGAMTDEYIDAMRSLFEDERPNFAGRFVSFSDIDAMPRPLQSPSPPFIVGGMSASAHRRAVKRGNGWYGFAMDLDATAAAVEGLAKAADQVARPDSLGSLEISVTPTCAIDAANVARFEELGVDRLILLPGGSSVDALLGQIDSVASAFL